MIKIFKMENITPLLEAIKKSQSLEEFFSKGVEFLKDYCKKIEIMWVEKNGRAKYAKKIGRKKIGIGELENLPEIKEEGGYRISETQTENLQKLVLKVKLKRKTSYEKFKNIADMIGKGADIVCERQENINKEKFIEREIEGIEEAIMSIAELSKTISECDVEKSVMKTFELAKKIGAENLILLTTYPEKRKITMKEDEVLEKKVEELLSSMEGEGEQKTPRKEKTEDGSILEIFPLNSKGKNIGTLIIKHISDELPFWFEKIIPTFISEVIAHREKEKEREKNFIFDMLNELNIGVAFFSKERIDTPAFRNEKFQEYITKIPSIEGKIKEDIILSVSLMTETMRTVEIDGRKFLISTHTTRNEREILLEIIEIKESS